MKNKRVLLGMSGGVDSSVSAILLQEQGYEVIGITMKLWESDYECTEGGCCNISSTNDAKRVCDILKIPHYTLNFKNQFNKHVIKDFISSYENCKTPNPCIECNRYLKFGAMYKKAQELGCDYIATGHYAKTEYSNKYNKTVLKKSDSIKKDQSYVLYSTPTNILEKIIFPLGNFDTKEQIRDIAKKYKLSIASKPDSQDICFIPDNNYIEFLEKNNIEFKKGNIVDMKEKILGQHTGLHRYTIGQRKGLGISNEEPLYVIGLNKEKNQVIVGKKQDTYTKKAYVTDFNNLLFSNKIENMKVNVKIRYSAKETEAIINQVDTDLLEVIFLKEQSSVTKGQSMVFYIDDIVLGGGKIM